MSNEVLPGDRIATIEEYEAGKNTYDDGMVIRTKMIGDVIVDKKERLVNVKNLSSNSFPKTDDIVIGVVEAVMGSMIVVSVQYIDYQPIVSKVECICPTRHIRKKNIALAKDLIKLKIAFGRLGTHLAHKGTHKMSNVAKLIVSSCFHHFCTVLFVIVISYASFLGADYLTSADIFPKAKRSGTNK